VSDGYTPGMMDSVCNTVLTERRVSQLAKKPLQAIEFIAPLARLDPVYKEEEEMFKVRSDVTLLFIRIGQ
jgi:IQ and AAA domain-containing protein